MDAWDALLAGPRGDFPRGPAAGPALPWRPGVIALLLLACLVPRLAAAWNWDVLWGDSLRYRYASILLEQGDYEHGFAEFGLNIYPLLLIPLRHLGIDWQIAGKYFSVLAASLTVLPLWGWLRRMFDDRLAILACLVYALHGKLIAISLLIIRDSTFWLLLALTLYYLWRAIGELRIAFFLAAGAALTLAVHTRLNSASGMHLQAPSSESMLPPPAKSTSPKDKPDTEKPETKTTQAPFPSILLPPVVPPEQIAPGWKLTFKLLERLAKAFTWVGAVLLLIGLIGSWRIFLRPEHLTLFGMNLLLLVIARIRYWSAGLDLRYFMPIVIVGLPWMALGIEHSIAAVRRVFERRRKLSPVALRILAGSLIAAAVAASLLDGPMAAANMRTRAAVGRWIRDHAGPEPAVAGNLDNLTLDTYYANARVVAIFWPRDCLIVPLPSVLRERTPEVVVLWNQENIAPEYLAMIEERVGACGYRHIDPKELPAGKNELMVFVRK